MLLKVVIIGGGAGGLACLQTILETEEYKSGQWSVLLLEEREDIGGIWLPAEPVDNPPKTPLYDSLTTNIPHPIMAYDTLLFPPETLLFPPASVVLDYLRTYAELNNLRPCIQLNSQVLETNWNETFWDVTFASNGVSKSITADRLIVANGHYRVPHFPSLPGVEDWRNAGLLSHAAWYRQPDMIGKVIVVVGGGPSGRDISRDYLEAARTVVWCVRGQANEDRGKMKLRGALVKLFLEDKTIEFKDGTRFGPIDHVILATGYDLSFPFLKSMVFGLPSISPLPSHLVNSKYSIFPLARFLFPIQDYYPPSSIAFICLPLKIVPFPLMEAQARAIITVFRDAKALDLLKEKRGIYDRFESMSDTGLNREDIAHVWDLFVGTEQFDYRDELNALAGFGDRKVEDWVKELYAARDKLRTNWRELVAKGSTEACLKGVGYGGVDDWIQFMYKLLERDPIS